MTWLRITPVVLLGILPLSSGYDCTNQTLQVRVQSYLSASVKGDVQSLIRCFTHLYTLLPYTTDRDTDCLSAVYHVHRPRQCNAYRVHILALALYGELCRRCRLAAHESST
jgi:hypothetical protein